MASPISTITFHPLSREFWPAFERLFGARGACGGCWCMWWRLKRSEYEHSKGEGNRQKMKRLVDGGEVPGILAMEGENPVGWVAVAPRREYVALSTSRILKPVDELPVWSIVCMFVSKASRRKGLSRKLIEAAVRYAKDCGARIVEAYPVEPVKEKVPDVFVFTGLASAFRKAGFVEAARRSPTRPVMRKMIR